jgi:DNA polymerase III subunit epsilon
MSHTPSLHRIPLREACFAAIDFESAGAEKGSTDAPVQMGLAVLAPGAAEPADFFRSFIHTDKPITWAAQKVHGITPAQLADAPTLLSLWPQVNGLLRGRIVVAHGMGTEKRFLRAFPMHGFGPWVDSLVVSQAVWPDMPSHSLGALGDRLGLTPAAQKLCPGLGYHDALFDSVVSLLLIQQAIQQAGLAQAPLDVFLKPDRRAYFARRKRR